MRPSSAKRYRGQRRKKVPKKWWYIYTAGKAREESFIGNGDAEKRCDDLCGNGDQAQLNVRGLDARIGVRCVDEKERKKRKNRDRGSKREKKFVQGHVGKTLAAEIGPCCILLCVCACVWSEDGATRSRAEAENAGREEKKGEGCKAKNPGK